MDFVDGAVITESTPAPGDDERLRRRIGESLVDTLAALHTVDWREVGLGDFGKPDGFNARQLRRMRSLIALDGAVPNVIRCAGRLAAGTRAARIRNVDRPQRLSESAT